MKEDYHREKVEYVVYVDDNRHEYCVEKGLEPDTDTEWYDFIFDNAVDDEERRLLQQSEHIRVYTVLPSVGDGLLITEFDTEKYFNENGIINLREAYEELHNEEGVKYDNGKPLAGDMIMIFPHALMGVAKCIEWGSHKYPQTDNYIRLKNGYKRYMNGIMRHLLKMMLGQQYDDETKLPHIYHVCWNALAICEHWFKDRSEEEKEELMKGLLMPVTPEEER